MCNFLKKIVDGTYNNDRETEVIRQSIHFDNNILNKCQRNNVTSYLLFSLNCHNYDRRFR